MDQPNKIILVTEATENQGSAVVKCLLADGWTVRALTRSLHRPAAKVLMKQGVEVLEVNLDDRTALDQAFVGVYGVYSVQSAADGDLEVEVRQGKLLADAAKAAGVQHFIYSSVGGVDRETGIPHLQGKWELEQYIHSLSLPATILRPAMLMDSFTGGGALNLTMIWTLGSLVRPDKAIQIIAVDDIACFAAIAFAQPERYVGRTLELAGDALTLSRIVKLRRRIQGGWLPSVRVPGFIIRRMPEEVRLLADWLEREGYQADIANLRQIHPSLMTYERWLRQKEAETQLKSYRPSPSYAA